MAREAQALARMAAGAFLGCNPALDPLAPHAPLRASRRRAEPALRAGLALVDLAAAYAIMSEAPRPLLRPAAPGGGCCQQAGPGADTRGVTYVC